MLSILLTFFVSLAFGQEINWVIANDPVDANDNRCPQEAVTKLEGDTFNVYTVKAQTFSFYGQFRQINLGRECWEKNASYIFGGMYCAETKFEDNTYTNVKCSTEFGSFKCNPNVDKEEHIVTAVTIENDSMTYIQRTYDYNEKKLLYQKCDYKKQ